jgi:hypothetical protein
MAADLKSLLIKYIDDGRSTPGLPQSNDPVEEWRQLDLIRGMKDCLFSIQSSVSLPEGRCVFKV